MNAHHPPYKTPLQRERHLRGWSLEDVVDGLQQLAAKHGYGELGVDANAVSRHERGVVKRPRAPLSELYCRLYRRPERLLWPRGDLLVWDDLPDLRDDPEIELPMPWIGRHVGLTDVERIRTDSELFGRMDHRHGGGHVHWLVIEYLRREVAPMLHGAYTQQVGRDLMVAAAGTAACSTRRADPLRAFASCGRWSVRAGRSGSRPRLDRQRRRSVSGWAVWEVLRRPLPTSPR
jgi:hypothetical protein